MASADRAVFARFPLRFVRRCGAVVEPSAGAGRDAAASFADLLRGGEIGCRDVAAWNSRSFRCPAPPTRPTGRRPIRPRKRSGWPTAISCSATACTSTAEPWRSRGRSASAHCRGPTCAAAGSGTTRHPSTTQLRLAVLTQPGSPGGLVRLWIDSGLDPEPDVLDGVLKAIDDKQATLIHPALGELHVPRDRLRRLRPIPS